MLAHATKLPALTEHALHLSEVLSTRFCHDITGPIGAVNNGAEFLQEAEGELLGQAMELITSSARQAVVRVQFYRQCYGAAKGEGDANLEQLMGLARDFFHGSKIAFRYVPPAAPVSVSRKMGKCWLNMILMTSDTLLRGGELTVRFRQEGTGVVLETAATAPVLRCGEELLEVLEGKVTPESLTAKNVQYYLTMLLAQESGAVVEYSQNESNFIMAARLA